MKNRKKKRFKLIKVKRKPEFKSPYMKALFEFFKRKGLNNHKAKLHAFALAVYQLKQGLPRLYKAREGGIILDDTPESRKEFKTNPNVSIRLKPIKDFDEDAIKAALRTLDEKIKIELQNQNHKPK